MLDGGDTERATRQAAVRRRQLLGEGRELLGGGARGDGDGLATVAALTQRNVDGHLGQQRHGVAQLRGQALRDGLAAARAEDLQARAVGLG